MTTIRIKQGKAWVELSGALAGDLEAHLDRALGPLSKSLLAAAEGIAGSAREKWPVRTGRSKDALRAGLRIDPYKMRVTGTVFGSRYDYFITWGHYRKIGPKLAKTLPASEYTATKEQRLWHSKYGKPYSRTVTVYRLVPPTGVSQGRGAVVKDLLRRQIDQAKPELTAALPPWLASVIESYAMQGARVPLLPWPKLGGTRRSRWSILHPSESARKIRAWLNDQWERRHGRG